MYLVKKLLRRRKKIQNILLTNLNQQVAWRREGEMYLVRLPPDPRPTQARDGVATNDWLSWEFFKFKFLIFHLMLTRQSASSSLEARVNKFPSAKVVNISLVIPTCFNNFPQLGYIIYVFLRERNSNKQDLCRSRPKAAMDEVKQA